MHVIRHDMQPCFWKCTICKNKLHLMIVQYSTMVMRCNRWTRLNPSHHHITLHSKCYKLKKRTSIVATSQQEDVAFIIHFKSNHFISHDWFPLISFFIQYSYFVSTHDSQVFKNSSVNLDVTMLTILSLLLVLLSFETFQIHIPSLLPCRTYSSSKKLSAHATLHHDSSQCLNIEHESDA